MMKRILFVAMLFASTTLFAQKDTVGLNIPFKDQKIVYEGVVEVPNKTKLELDVSAMKFLSFNFNDIGESMQNKNEEEVVDKGTLTTTITGRMGTPWNFKNKMTVKIDFKDNKYSYQIFDITTSLPDGNIDVTPIETAYSSLISGKWVINKKFTKSLLVNLNADINAFIGKLKEAMNSKKESF
jgi:hypothetical protein